MSVEVTRPVVGELWARGEFPSGSAAQIAAWLRASGVPLAVLVVVADESEVQFMWPECGGGWMAPVDRATGKFQGVPDARTVWEPVRVAPRFRLPLGEFVAAFRRVP